MCHVQILIGYPSVCFWYMYNPQKAFIHGKRERRFYGLYSCRAVLNVSTESAHTTLSGSWFQRTIVSTKNECLDCSVLQSGTSRPFEFFIKRLSMIFVVSQSLYTLALIFLLCLAVVMKSAVVSVGTNPSTTLWIRRRLCRLSSSVSSSNCRFMVVIDPGSYTL